MLKYRYKYLIIKYKKVSQQTLNKFKNHHCKKMLPNFIPFVFALKVFQISKGCECIFFYYFHFRKSINKTVIRQTLLVSLF
jgi:hypothetical protein